MKVYRTYKYDNRIEEREVTKVTDKWIFYVRRDSYNGKEINERELKITNYHIWHDTKEAAIGFLIKGAEGRIEFHERELSKAKSELEEMKKNLPCT